MKQMIRNHSKRAVERSYGSLNAVPSDSPKMSAQPPDVQAFFLDESASIHNMLSDPSSDINTSKRVELQLNRGKQGK
jgi:hypothetical protein